jgi:seryl-tRNA synthetase
MIDLVLMRESPEYVVKTIQRKDPQFPIEDLVALDIEVRALRQGVEELRSEKNVLAQKGSLGISDEIRQQSIALGLRLKEAEQKLAERESVFKELYLHCPNMILDELPDGGKEANRVVKTFGTRPEFGFAPKTHLELGEALGWLDFEAAATITGSNFALYRGPAVQLHYALCMFMVNTARSYGYQQILPPFLVNERALEGASNFPRFKDEVYSLERDGLYLTPTAEVNLANMYRDAILSETELPVRMTALTSCFRREAGGYGASERGLIRIHQFDKVELFTLCEPEKSSAEQERMLACAESILQALGLHYQISLLAARDCSFASAKTFDIEVWMPGQKEYKEVSSISNCTDFQSRRCAIRYRGSDNKKTRLVYTLNGSSLALPRLVVALLETGQRADGTIVFPDVLKTVSVGV